MSGMGFIVGEAAIGDYLNGMSVVIGEAVIHKTVFGEYKNVTLLH
jgi:hypothetical protein